jgi:acetyl-CoA carboxylase biotin carboxyl carrier protein
MARTNPFDPELVRELAGLLAETDLTEIEVEKGDLRIRVARQVTQNVMLPSQQYAPPAPAPAAVAPPPVAAEPAPAINPREHPGALTSPMVGTAYRRSSPDSKPFVEIGTRVEIGDKLLLVEAMKTFNDIVATKAGIVTAIFFEDGQPVEYGEPLLIVE